MPSDVLEKPFATAATRSPAMEIAANIRLHTLYWRCLPLLDEQSRDIFVDTNIRNEKLSVEQAAAKRGLSPEDAARSLASAIGAIKAFADVVYDVRARVEPAIIPAYEHWRAQFEAQKEAGNPFYPFGQAGGLNKPTEIDLGSHSLTEIVMQHIIAACTDVRDGQKFTDIERVCGLAGIYYPDGLSEKDVGAILSHEPTGHEREAKPKRPDESEVELEAGQDTDTRPKSNRITVPTEAHERQFALARQWRDSGDEKALHGLFDEGLRFAEKLAGKFSKRAFPGRNSYDDLRGEAMIGLLEGCRSFNPEYGIKLVTWVNYSISTRLAEYTLGNADLHALDGFTLRMLFGHNKRGGSNMSRIIRRMRTLEAASSENSETLGISADDAAAVAGAMRVADHDPDAGAWENALASGDPNPEAKMIQRTSHEMRQVMCIIRDDLLSGLPREARAVVSAILLSEEHLTYAQWGERLGRSKQAVQQMWSNSIDHMRRQAHEKGYTQRLRDLTPS